ncbi:MAG TPA: glutathione binding-like protein [Stellaceae bacterium]|nr:glutathione binding-like protein [Stellaceae bacterium]
MCIERYTSEVKRLHRVLDHRPAEAPYLAGEEYSIADIAAFPWVRQPERRGIDLADYPAVKRRHARFAARPAVERCCAVPAERARSGQIGDPERENLFGATQFQAR